jgi:hypothetical protein
VAVICLVGGLVFGMLVGIFFLPSVIGSKGLLETGAEIVLVNTGTRQERDFGDYHYIFYNNFPSIVTNEYGPTVLELDGNYATIPIDNYEAIPMNGSVHTVLGLQVMVYEYNDDYVIYLAKLP